MAITNKNGYAIDAVLAETLNINGAGVLSTNAVTIQDTGSDRVFFVVEADANITLENGHYISAMVATGASYDGYHQKAIVTQGETANVAFSKGDIILMFPIPEALLGKSKSVKVYLKSDHGTTCNVNVYTVIR